MPVKASLSCDRCRVTDVDRRVARQGGGRDRRVTAERAGVDAGVGHRDGCLRAAAVSAAPDVRCGVGRRGQVVLVNESCDRAARLLTGREAVPAPQFDFPGGVERFRDGVAQGLFGYGCCRANASSGELSQPWQWTRSGPCCQQLRSHRRFSWQTAGIEGRSPSARPRASRFGRSSRGLCPWCRRVGEGLRRPQPSWRPSGTGGGSWPRVGKACQERGRRVPSA